MNTITEDTESSPHLTGTHINYFFVCTRKLWLFHHGVTMEHRSDLVALGRLVHEESYERDRKEIAFLDHIRIDRITPGGVIHEIKKSDKLEEAHAWQLRYYLSVLKSQGIWPLTGKLEYPKLRKTIDIQLTEHDEHKLVKAMQEITQILRQQTPPKMDKMKICRKCAYFEFCWG